MNNNQDNSKQQELNQGVYIFVILAVVTVIEYFLGVNATPMIFMWILALLKAGLVLVFFMHIKRAFRDEGGH